MQGRRNKNKSMCTHAATEIRLLVEAWTRAAKLDAQRNSLASCTFPGVQFAKFEQICLHSDWEDLRVGFRFLEKLCQGILEPLFSRLHEKRLLGPIVNCLDEHGGRDCFVVGFARWTDHSVGGHIRCGTRCRDRDKKWSEDRLPRYGRLRWLVFGFSRLCKRRKLSQPPLLR